MLGNEYFRQRDSGRARAVQARAADQSRLRPRHRSTWRAPTARSATTMRRSLGYERYLAEGSEERLGPVSARRALRRSRASSTRPKRRSSRRWPTTRASRRRATRSASSRSSAAISARAEQRDPRRARAESRTCKLAHFNLALIAEQRGDLPTAMAEYQKEIDTQAERLQGGLQSRQALRAAGHRRGAGSGVSEGDRDEPAVRRGVFLPRQALAGPGTALDEAIAPGAARPGGRRRSRSSRRSDTTCSRTFTAAAAGWPNARREAELGKAREAANRRREG